MGPLDGVDEVEFDAVTGENGVLLVAGAEIEFELLKPVPGRVVEGTVPVPE